MEAARFIAGTGGRDGEEERHATGGFLLVKRGRRIGRMSAKDGSVTEIGRARNGEVFEAEWVAGEAR
ncbi:MAG: hypothetical protein ACR2FZ_04640 [Thermoleophilaceae bacterium]